MSLRKKLQCVLTLKSVADLSVNIPFVTRSPCFIAALQVRQSSERCVHDKFLLVQSLHFPFPVEPLSQHTLKAGFLYSMLKFKYHL